MPLIQISLLEGRDPELVSQCAKDVARTVHQTLGAPLESIRVLVTQMPASQWFVGDKSRAEIDAAKKAQP